MTQDKEPEKSKDQPKTPPARPDKTKHKPRTTKIDKQHKGGTKKT